MDIQKAEQLAELVKRKNRYEGIIKGMKSGFSDEWQFKNSHTGITVDLSCDDWAEIKTMAQRELDEVMKKIKEI